MNNKEQEQEQPAGQEITEETYVSELWFIHGWDEEDEYDFQMMLLKAHVGAPWTLTLRKRRYKDNNLNPLQSEDEKTFYSIKLGQDEYTEEKELIAKIDKIAKNLCAHLKGDWDKLIIHGIGGEAMYNAIIDAKKPWIHMTKVELDKEDPKNPN